MSITITDNEEYNEKLNQFAVDQVVKTAKRYLLENKNKDMVNHPAHYQGLDGLEVDEVMQNFIPKYENAYVGAMICNVLKYILCAPSKGKQLEDLKKAKVNLEFAIDKLEKMNEVQ